MIGSIINDRYRIDSELGQGGMGTVYRAHDSTLKRDVAVKLMFNAKIGTDGRARLLHEAQATAKLNHPNIVTVHDAGEIEDSPYIVMELIEGQTLHENHPNDLQEIITIIKQVCTALEHAHTNGIIHRDLKPENVILESDGTAKLMDFGLARSVTSRLTSEGTLIGTVFYMAPEQAMGREIDARTDLYSLGVMFYELATGELPFMDDDPVAVISQHLYAPLVPPRAKNSEIPTALNDLIVRLLNKDPADRPASAKEVIELLESPTQKVKVLRDSKELSLLDRIVRGRIVGRQNEVHESRELWRKAASREGQLLFISGEPGIGKTRLTREITTHVEISGGQTIIGESFAEGGPPYDAIAQIVRLAFEKNKDIAKTIPEAVLADILKITPDLQPLYPDALPNPSLDPYAEQQRLLENGVMFFAALAEKTPVMLVFDDLHWAESGTLNMVRHLARRTRDLPILILATYREIEIEEARLFQDFLLDMDRARLATRIKLARLEMQQTEELLAAIFQEDITPEFLEEIHHETEGNPFFIEEVCKALVESGQVYFENGEWHHPENIKNMVIPQSVKTAMEQRLNRLNEESRRVLTLASVIGREFDFDVLLELSELDENALLDVIDEALRAQLIREKRVAGRDIYIFEHALINHTLYDDLNLRRKTRLHQQAGLAMEKAYANQIESHTDELAHHFFLGARGEVIEKAIGYNEMAAEQAFSVFAFADAVKFYEQVINLLEDLDRIPETIPYWIKIGDVNFIAVKRDKVIKIYVKAIELWESLPEKDREKEIGIQAYSKTGEARRFGGIVPGARQYVEKGLAMIDNQPTMVRAKLLKGLAWVTSYMVTEEESDLTLAKKAGEEALSLFKSFEAHDEVSGMLDCLASLHGIKNDFPKALEITEQRLELVDHLSVTELADAYHMIGDYSYVLNLFPKAEEYDLKTLKLEKDHQILAWQFQVRWDLVKLYLDWDRWEDALQIIHEYIDLDIKTGGVYWNSNIAVPGLTTSGSTIYHLRGEPQKAEALNEIASQSILPEEVAARSFRVHVDQLFNVELLLGLGKVPEAQDMMEKIDKQRLISMNHYRINVTEIELLDDPSLDAYLDLEKRVEEETPWDKLLLGRIKRLAGVGYSNNREFDLGEDKLNQSSELFEDLGTCWQQGRTLDALGDLYMKQGKKKKAIEKYNLAISLFEGLQARFNIDKTNEKLKALN
ncbi:MAG: protein kinase [Chloroflexi bacterium]|nr:protein kinase [Chloroflexota bacterium]